jgi:hypothetical protein
MKLAVCRPETFQLEFFWLQLYRLASIYSTNLGLTDILRLAEKSEMQIGSDEAIVGRIPLTFSIFSSHCRMHANILTCDHRDNVCG